MIVETSAVHGVEKLSKVLRPTQPNRAYDIVAKKLCRSLDGEMKDWGLNEVP